MAWLYIWFLNTTHCDLDLWTPKLIGHILTCNSKGICVLSSMIDVHVKGNQLYANYHFSNNQCIVTLNLWRLEPEIKRIHPWLVRSLCVKCHECMCKESNNAPLPFPVINAMQPWPLTLLNMTSIGHILNAWGVFGCRLQDDMCKGKGVMQHIPLSVINALWPWRLDPEINSAHPQLNGNLCVYFMMKGRFHYPH